MKEIINVLNKDLKKLIITFYLLLPILLIVLVQTGGIMLNEIEKLKDLEILAIIYLVIGLTPYIIFLIRYTKFWATIRRLRKQSTSETENLHTLISNYKALNKPNISVFIYMAIAIALYISYYYNLTTQGGSI